MLIHDIRFIVAVVLVAKNFCIDIVLAEQIKQSSVGATPATCDASCVFYVYGCKSKLVNDLYLKVDASGFCAPISVELRLLPSTLKET